MTVQIKPLKGFNNPINNEKNTLSLLVKSDYGLNEHLHESKQKLLISLASIINHHKDAQKINFYHKLLVPIKSRSDYLVTKWYEISLNSLKRELDNSFKEVIESCPNNFYSHFINIIITKNDEVLKLSDDKFIKLNNIIRSAISNINYSHFLFIDNIPFEKTMRKIEKKDTFITKQTKRINEKYIHILRQHVEYLTL